MGSELEHEYYNEIIENYISFATILNEGGFVCLHLTLKLKGGAGFADLDMALAYKEVIMDLPNEDHQVIYTHREKNIGFQLLEAARHGDHITATQLLASNPSLIFYRVDGNTVLHVATMQGNMSFVKKLIEFINVYNPLEFPSKSPYLVVNDDGNTALHLALKFKHYEVAYELIKALPEPKVVYAMNKSKEMPITLALREGYINLVEDMLKLAPWSSLCQHTKEIILHSTIGRDAMKLNLEMLQIVLDMMPTLAELTFEGGCTLLTYAINMLAIDKVRYLLKKYPNTATKCDKTGSYPIHRAVLLSDDSRSLEIVKELVSCVPETLYQVDAEGQSVLHLIVKYTKPEALSYLKTLPELRNIFPYKDDKGNTFLDLVKEQMGIYFKKPSCSLRET